MKFKMTLPFALLMLAMSSDLHEAVLEGNVKKCKMLLEAGADVNKKNEFGKTALMMSVLRKEEECFHCILDSNKLQVNLGHDFGRTALHLAVCWGNEAMCAALLARGADVNAQDEAGNTPLMEAMKFGMCGCAEMMLEEADVKLANAFGQTAMHFAVMNKNAKMCGHLLEKGADANAQNTSGSTPLMKAIEFGNNKNAKMILKKCADLGIECSFETALDFAREKENDEIIQILEIAEEQGIIEAARFIKEEKQPLVNIRNYVEGKGEKLKNIKL